MLHVDYVVLTYSASAPPHSTRARRKKSVKNAFGARHDTVTVFAKPRGLSGLIPLQHK